MGLAATIDSYNFVQVFLGVVGTGGLLGAFIAIFKLRPDANTQAVTQSRDVMESMARLNEKLEHQRDEFEIDRDRWRQRALEAERKLSLLRPES